MALKNALASQQFPTKRIQFKCIFKS